MSFVLLRTLIFKTMLKMFCFSRLEQILASIAVLKRYILTRITVLCNRCHCPNQIYLIVFDSSKHCKDCDAPSLYSENYCCLPKSIILCPQQQCPVNSKPMEIFDLDASIKSAFPILSKEYRLSCILVRYKETNKRDFNKLLLRKL